MSDDEDDDESAKADSFKRSNNKVSPRRSPGNLRSPRLSREDPNVVASVKLETPLKKSSGSWPLSQMSGETEGGNSDADVGLKSPKSPGSPRRGTWQEVVTNSRKGSQVDL